jgi:hypothetical protein
MGTEIDVGEFPFERVAPNAMSLRVAAFENDQGNPDDLAKMIQDEIAGSLPWTESYRERRRAVL